MKNQILPSMERLYYRYKGVSGTIMTNEEIVVIKETSDPLREYVWFPGVKTEGQTFLIFLRLIL
jgi:hypothetical protein